MSRRQPPGGRKPDYAPRAPATQNGEDIPALAASLLAKFGLGNNHKAARDLAFYVQSLVAWNRKLNLTGFDSPWRILDELVVDSFYLAPFLADPDLPENARIWEPGAGGGLPGIPLRILLATGQYTMIETRRKRAIFLSTMLANLNLPNTGVYRGSVEDFFAAETREGHKADRILSRAFRPWPEMLALCAPLLAPHGRLVVMSSQRPPTPPQGWNLSASACYPVNNKTRWLWAFTLASQPNAK